MGPIYRARISVYIHKMGNRKVCGDLNIRILRCGHPFAMKRIHVFNNGKIRIWQCKDTGTMNRPLRLAECKLGVFMSVRWEFRG